MTRFALVCSLLMLAAPAAAQDVRQAPPVARTVSLSGPRFGLTFLPPGAVEMLADRNIEVRPTISQFGWQFERQFFSKEGSGVTALHEWVFLLGGLDQGVALPSVSWMVGLRTRDGAEFGIGPNVTPAGVALAFAGGITIRTGILNVPMNVAVVPSKVGTRISVMTGFNFRKSRY